MNSADCFTEPMTLRTLQATIPNRRPRRFTLWMKYENFGGTPAGNGAGDSAAVKHARAIRCDAFAGRLRLSETGNRDTSDNSDDQDLFRRKPASSHEIGGPDRL